MYILVKRIYEKKKDPELFCLGAHKALTGSVVIKIKSTCQLDSFAQTVFLLNK